MISFPEIGPNGPDAADWSDLIANWSDTKLLFADAFASDVVAHCAAHPAYLATPYTRLVTDREGNWDPAASDAAGQAAARWCAVFAECGQTVVSPIVQAVEMVNQSSRLDPLDVDFWMHWCAPMLRGCQAVIVPPIPGWRSSWGVWSEVCYALGHNCRVFLVADISTNGGI